jgi:hypothetical protein
MSGVGIAMGYRLDGFDSRKYKICTFSKLWDSPSPLSNGHGRLFLGGKAARA